MWKGTEYEKPGVSGWLAREHVGKGARGHAGVRSGAGTRSPQPWSCAVWGRRQGEGVEGRQDGEEEGSRDVLSCKHRTGEKWQVFLILRMFSWMRCF